MKKEFFDPYAHFQEVVLDNGMILELCPLSYASRVVMKLLIKVGGRDGLPGLSHFVEHFLSTDPRLKKRLSKEVEKYGGSIRLGATSRTSTEFHGMVPVGKEALLLKSLNVLLSGPVFPRKEFAREVAVIKNEISNRVMTLKTNERMAEFHANVYPKNCRPIAYSLCTGLDILGEPDQLQNFPWLMLKSILVATIVPIMQFCS